MFFKLILVMGVLMMANASINAAPKPFFPIIAWDYVDDEATIKSMADCGINVVAFVPSKMLDACQKYGVKAILWDEKVGGDSWTKPFNGDKACEALPALIKKVNNHPAVYGYHLKDEPDGGQFTELAKAVKVVRELAPGKWPYINLPPGTGDGYDGYLDAFANTCNPTVISYDNYPLGQDGSFSWGFWANICDVRKAALKHKLPFYTIVLSVAHLTYGEPTAAAMRLQVYGSLVYGARGVSYYKFISRELPILDAPDLGDWRMGPLDQFLNKTPNWDWVRNVNLQVQNLAPTLLKLKSDDVYHIGDIPERNHGATDKTLLKGLNSGEMFVVGDFTHEEDGSRWVMIVNRHLKNSTTCGPEFNVPAKRVMYVSPFTGELKPFPSPWYCLAPGQGVLLKLVND